MRRKVFTKVLIFTVFLVLGPSVSLNAEVSKHVLKNGITVILNKESNVPIVTVTVFVKTGSYFENEDNNGITSLTFNLFLKGTTTKSSEKLAEEIETIGAGISTDISEDYSTVSLACTQKYFTQGLDLLADIIKNPAFDDKEIDKQKKIALARIKSREDNSFDFALKNFRELIYGKHTYSFDDLGEEKSVSRIEKEKIIEYYKKYFRPENIVISVSGDFFDDVLDLLTKRFEEAAAGSEKDNVKEQTQEVKLVPGKERVIQKNKKQSIVMLGFLAPAIADKDYPALKVLSTALGGGMSSKLFNELREKQGLAYEVGSFYPTKKFTSSFVFYAGTRKENIEKVKTGFLKIIKNIKEGTEITDSDLESAKNYLVGNYYLDQQTNARKSWYFGWFELLGKGYGYSKGYADDISNVKLDDIKRVSKEYFLNYALLVVESTD